MSANRMTQHFERTRASAPRPPEVPAGFAAIPMQPLKDAQVNCQSPRSVYEMAYLFARMGYVVGE